MKASQILVMAAVAPAVVFGQTDPCAGFTTQDACEDTSPAADHCIWASSDPSGVSVDPSTFVCRTFGCNDISEGTGTNAAAECARFGGCTWNADAYFCLRTGQTLPCQLNTDQSSCASPCVWDSSTYACNPAGYTPPCDAHYDQSSCAAEAGCTWTPAPAGSASCSGVCTAGAPTCAAYQDMPQECCPTASCNWVDTSTTGGECHDPGEVVACEAYTDADSCDAPRCAWRADLFTCTAADRNVPCPDMEQAACQASAACQWNAGSGGGDYDDGADQGTCDNCPTTNCTQAVTGGGIPTDAPDTGAACSSYSGDTCPQPRCFQDYGDDSGCGDGVCRDAQCRDLVSESTLCGQLTGCSFDSTAGVCYNTTAGAAYPCDEVFEQDSCPSAHGCTWQAASSTFEEGLCYVQAQGIPCSAYDAGDASDCPSPCHWEPAMQQCLDSGVEAPCRAFGSDSSCPTDRCQVVNGLCWAMGSSPSCTDFCAPYECAASGICQWDENQYACTPCAGGTCPQQQACSSYTSDESCPESHCFWVFDDEAVGGTAGTCSDLECTEVYDATSCAAISGCTWEANSFSCWLQGVSQPCSNYYSQSDCTAASCTWNDAAYTCLEQGETAPCHLFYEQPCPSGCVWDSNQDTCELPLATATPPTLNGAGSHDPSQCTDAMLTQYDAILARANAECSYGGDGRRRRQTGGGGVNIGPTQTQLECLNYVVTSGGTTLTTICPCLWRYAEQVHPQDDFWFRINC